MRFHRTIISITCVGLLLVCILFAPGALHEGAPDAITTNSIVEEGTRPAAESLAINSSRTPPTGADSSEVYTTRFEYSGKISIRTRNLIENGAGATSTNMDQLQDAWEGSADEEFNIEMTLDARETNANDQEQTVEVFVSAKGRDQAEICHLVPARVRIAATGEVSGFIFTSNTAAGRRTFIKSIVTDLLSCPRVDPNATKWTAEYEDTTGLCEAIFKIDGGDINNREFRTLRTKLRYLHSSASRAGVGLTILDSSAETNKINGWPARHRSFERVGLRVFSKDSDSLEFSTDTTIQLVNSQKIRRVSDIKFEQEYEKPSAARVETETAAVPRRPSNGELLEVLSALAAMLEEIGDGQSIESYQLWTLLVSWLQHYPDLCENVALWMEPRMFTNAKGLGHLIGAFAAAGARGEPEPQHVLARWIINNNIPRALRMDAVVSTVQIGALCAPDLLRAIEASCKDNDPVICNVSELALGTRRSYVKDQESLLYLDKALQELKSRCIAEGRVADFLRVSVNSEDSRLCQTGIDYINSSDGDTRAWAARAIGYVETSNATEILARLSNDDDARVRESAMIALGRRPFGDDILQLVRRSALEDESLDVRRAAVGVLNNDGSEAAIRILQQIAAGDRSPEMREFAASALQQRPKR